MSSDDCEPVLTQLVNELALPAYPAIPPYADDVPDTVMVASAVFAHATYATEVVEGA